MLKTVAIGLQDFEKVLERNAFYVDKTAFIKEWWESGDDVTLITRPRRFGKTLTMSMLDYFFSIDHAGSDLFKDLEIWKYKEYRILQGAYPVISLSFSNVKENSISETKSKIYTIIQFLYVRYSFLLACDVLTEFEKEKFRNVLADMNDSEASVSLQQLSGYLYRYYGKRVVILLDEYDTPMQEAFMNGYWDELSVFIRNLFNATFKGNPYLEKAIMTGITRVSKESIFSDLNNLNVITTTSREYADCFGFTEREVFESLAQYNLSDKKKQVKDWYDGFTFGDCTDIYNPWSIINYLNKRQFAPYWANTSSNGLVGRLVREGSNHVKKKFEDLLNDKSLKVSLDEQIVFNQLSYKESSIWSLLLTSGYLKVIKTELDEQTGQMYYWVALTNKEVRIMFDNIIRGWWISQIEEKDYMSSLLEKGIPADHIKKYGFAFCGKKVLIGK